ncbi:MAG: tyrosine-type recombinase/integrase [Verrucomicrobiia bacterium]
MKGKSKNKYRSFQNKKTGIYFIQDNETGRQQSLKTRDKTEAARLASAKNEAHRQPQLNLQIARSYILAADPKLVARTWQDVMQAIVNRKQDGPTKDRWAKAIENADYDSIRNLRVVETGSDDFEQVLKSHKPSTNVYLRRVHNFALGMDWLLKPVIPRREWPRVVYGKKRGITLEEHQKIIERESNPERRDFYELCWELGGSQSDIADLHAEDVDWSDCTIGYGRRKLKDRSNLRVSNAIITFSEAVAAILRRRPQTGPLFPYLRTVRAGDRATEFHQRCAGLKIHGVTLHSYRYAWAERARACGFPLRFAQEALGHNSKAVHHAYASKAEVKVPSLETWEKQMRDKIISLKSGQTRKADSQSDGEKPELPVDVS